MTSAFIDCDLLKLCREEEGSLRQKLKELKEEVSSKTQQRSHRSCLFLPCSQGVAVDRLLLQSEVVDLKDTVNRRKTEIDVEEMVLERICLNSFGHVR